MYTGHLYKMNFKQYIKGTHARDTKSFDKMQVINKILAFGKFGPIGWGTAFKRVLRLRISGPLRLRIYPYCV